MKKSIGDLIDTYNQIRSTVNDLQEIAKRDMTTGNDADTCESAIDLLLEYKEMLRARVVEL